MEGNRLCNKCGGRSVVFDSPNWVCCQCGTVQDSDHFVSHLDVYTENLGRSVAIGRSNPTVSVNFGGRRIFIQGDYTYKERKEFEARRTIEDITSRLDLSASRANDVKYMVEKITEDRWGGGCWFLVLVGACAYIVARQNQLPLTLKQVADVINYDVHELGQMYIRVRRFLKLDLPETNIFMLLEWAIQNSPSFVDIPKDKIAGMIKQGKFLLQCSIKWFLTTGRHPLPMITAIVAFVAEINGAEAGVDDISKELSACNVTSRQRLKELQESLVEVAKTLPWGGDVTTKSITHHAPFIIQFMQLKSKIKPASASDESLSAQQRLDMETLPLSYESSDHVKAVLNELLELPSESSIYRCTAASNAQPESDVINAGDELLLHASPVDYEKLKLSVECLRNAYARFKERDVSELEDTREGACGAKRQKRNGLPSSPDRIRTCLSNLDLNMRVSTHGLLEQDVGLDSFPPSFLTSMDASRRRRRRIIAAKQRINKIVGHKFSSLSSGSRIEQDSVSDAEACCRESRWGKSEHCQQAVESSIEWEDIVIELLLLHQVSEEEIETGYYRSLLDLHVFNSGHNISNEELGSYLRSKEEVALLSLLKDWE